MERASSALGEWCDECQTRKDWRSYTNYRLKDGDTVILTTYCTGEYIGRADMQVTRGLSGYWTIPAGTIGKVVTARVPKVVAVTGDSLYFAIVTVEVNCEVYTVRCPHSSIRKPYNTQHEKVQGIN